MATAASRQCGMAMLEALIAMVVLLIGLLGIVGLQAKTHTLNFEAYQRGQALLLLDDMANRIKANRYAAPCYAFSQTDGRPYLGTDGPNHKGDASCSAVAGTTQSRAIAESGMGEWNLLLQGANETAGGENRGAMIGARGCVTFDAATGLYTVIVTWQGMSATMAPAVACANGMYGTETRRRAVRTTLRIPSLTE
ncbi:MAG TPA: type IV pilus modification protein PilV [Burkholderiales bacterium]